MSKVRYVQLFLILYSRPVVPPVNFPLAVQGPAL